uniref:Mitochondrial ribonuclease P catalytic subunit n=1 Tax=Strigamia maritima TaxID=126957 RepID=T1JCD8_STRMM
MKLCATCYDEENEELIVNAYDDLRKMNIDFNSEVLDACIFALAGTKLWANGIELMKIIRRNGEKISEDAYCAFIRAAFKNKKFDLGYETLKSFNQIPTNEVVIEWCNLCADDDEIAHKLVDFFAWKKLTVPLSITDKIQSSFDKKNHVGKYVTISPDGYCSHCDTYLEKNENTDTEFSRLREDVMNSVIRGKDVFLKTNSTELRSFENFVKMTGPYDIVVDGLNVAYNNLARGSKYELSKQLIRMLRHLATVKKHKNILVLGKQHMNSWPKEALATIKLLSHCFLTERLSQDDTFLLYATLASGPNTFFVSNDFMRDHIVCLKNKDLTEVFRKWQWSHQIYHLINKDDELELLPPTTFKLTAQRTETSVHIPCSEEDQKTSLDLPKQ